MVGLGGLTLALCAAALWRVIDPLTRGEIALVPEARAPHRLRELEREKQAVLKAIKEIELDYQMRKISQVDYREMVERYRARALRVMGDLAAGEDYRALIERELRDRLAARTVAASENPPTASASADTGAMSDPDRDFNAWSARYLADSLALEPTRATQAGEHAHDAGCKLLITATGGYRRGQVVPLKRNADKAVAAAADFVGSTGAMMKYVKTTTAPYYLMLTEC